MRKSGRTTRVRPGPGREGCPRRLDVRVDQRVEGGNGEVRKESSCLTRKFLYSLVR